MVKFKFKSFSNENNFMSNAKNPEEIPDIKYEKTIGEIIKEMQKSTDSEIKEKENLKK